MSPRFKTPNPTKTSCNEIPASFSTHVHIDAYLSRDSAATLVGELPPPGLSKARPAQSISSQRATSSRETSISVPFGLSSDSSTISARRKPVCKTCGTPRKGHKRGPCAPSSVPSDEYKALYVSSPENERTPTKASALAESRTTPVKSAASSISAISSAITAVSAGGTKRRPIHRGCGLPMKGHKRQNGVLICRTDHNQGTSPTSPPRTKVLKGMDQEPGYRSKDLGSPSNREVASMSNSAHASRVSLIKPATRVFPIGRKCRSDSPNPFESTDSFCSSLSAYAPSTASDSQPTGAVPSFKALNDALGEPALVIYPAWNRDEVSQIRQQAKALHLFNGVVNVKVEEKDGFDLTRAIKKCNTDDQGVPSYYMKWVIVSEKEEMVKKYLDLCAERPSEV